MRMFLNGEYVGEVSNKVEAVRLWLDVLCDQLDSEEDLVRARTHLIESIQRERNCLIWDIPKIKQGDIHVDYCDTYDSIVRNNG